MKEDNPKKIIGVIQVRVGSTRLPKKALKEVLGKTLIELIAERLSFCKELDDIVISTADTKENEVIESLAKKIRVPCYRGSETDLTRRLYETAKKFFADAIVRITGDCPLVDPAIVDRLIKAYKSDTSADLVTNVFPPSFPDGMDVEVLSVKTLERLDKEIADPLYREWLTTTIMEQPQSFKIINILHEENLAHLRLTVDYKEDLELIRNIFERLYEEEKVFHLADILNVLIKEPKLMNINKKWIDTTIINNSRLKAFYTLRTKQ